MDLELTVDVARLAAAAGAQLTRGDVCLLKFVLSSALYPNIALPAIGNMHRRDADMRFHLPNGKDASLHPSSGLAARSRELDSTCGVVYVEALETRALFLCNNIPVPALHALLLSAARVDTSLDGSRMVVDRWLLLRIQGDDGPRVLLSVARARRALTRLMGEKLRSALQQRRRRPDSEEGDGTVGGEAAAGMAFYDTDAVQGAAPDFLHELPAWVSRVSGAWLEPQADGAGGEVAEQLAAAFLWPVRYTVERLTGTAAAAQYNSRSGNKGVDTEGVKGEQEGTGAVKTEVESQESLGGGHAVTPWLHVGALRGVESGLAAHATLPALRRHWNCPGCSARLIATAEDIASHVESCPSAMKLEPGVLENSYGGHQVAASSAPVVKLEQDKLLLEDFKPAPEEKLVLSRARDPALVLPHGGTSSSQRLSRQRGNASFDNAVRGGGEESRRTEVRKEYYCHWCSTSLVLSATEFLKHKQLHQRDGD